MVTALFGFAVTASRRATTPRLAQQQVRAAGAADVGSSSVEARLSRLEGHLSRLEPTMDRARRALDDAERTLRGRTPVGPDAEGAVDGFVSAAAVLVRRQTRVASLIV